MTFYARQGKLVARPGQRDALAAIMLDPEGNLESMPGCRLYLVLASESEPDALIITEVWESEEAHRASLSLPKVVETITRARPVLERAEGGPLVYLGGAGIE